VATDDQDEIACEQLLQPVANRRSGPIAGDQHLSAKYCSLLGALIGRLHKKREPARAMSFMRPMHQSF
jgi:hypothetical protein